MTVPRSTITPDQAVARALALVGTGTYRLGPTEGDLYDCVGLAWEKVYGMPRHIPGLNRGLYHALLSAGFPPDLAGAYNAVDDVEDDVNTNALIADALTLRRYVEIVDTPFPGALICYPTIHLDGHPQPWIGHIGVVIGVSRATSWDVDRPAYELLETVQMCGPNGRHPGVLAVPGYAFAHHDALWPRPDHRCVMLRVLP